MHRPGWSNVSTNPSDDRWSPADAQSWSHTRGLLSALEEIDSRLDVGLSYDDLGNRLGDASVAYNRMNFKA